ncbi:exocyst complex component Sec6 [Piedraia hortae CBS 480.64]|uniref:Exocyst complex component Sec6 n=1 Tax=Piedraia hortae CBS 480.64 TaxID=1314780 RepID=A0A6A7C4J0_9PEZI|nr:exocyst complex component Sec6 [Piedraia hortae CBS 480.64]
MHSAAQSAGTGRRNASANPMDGHDDPYARVAELLKHPDDLDAISGIKNELARNKAAIDGQLKIGLQEHMAVTQKAIGGITDGQAIVSAIKEEMMQIDRLCTEAQGMIRDFAGINKLSLMQRNFAAVKGMKEAVESFGLRLVELQQLLAEDDEDMDDQPNLLAIHEGISSLRDMRDQALDQVQSSAAGSDGESGLELIENLPLKCAEGATLRDLFGKLDEVGAWFDSHVDDACSRLPELVDMEKKGLVVRLGLVIEKEEQKDRQTKAVREAQKEFQDIASRFKTANAGQREVREYKKKLLDHIQEETKKKFDQVRQSFIETPEKLDKSTRWFFLELNIVKLGMRPLLPKKWKIFSTYMHIYHQQMHDFLVSQLEDVNISPVHMLAILDWVPKYYSKLKRLGVKDPEVKLLPHVIDEREADLIREYRGLITSKVEEWMERMAQRDTKEFEAREDVLDVGGDGCLHTKSLGDMWTMHREQLSVAEQSGRPDVIEGVVDAMMQSLRTRQQMWQRLVDNESLKYGSESSDLEGLPAYQDWLIAIANDQITNIDDSSETGQVSYLTRFKRDYEPLVSPSYPISSESEHESLMNGYIDLASHCLRLFAELLFKTDFRSITKTFFTSAWYTETTMSLIVTTFEDYLMGENNIMQVLHPSLQEIIIVELSDALLIAYLESVKNKSAKFRRNTDPFTAKIREDLMTVFNFFENFPYALDQVKERWRVVNAFVDLIVADKTDGEVVEAFKRFRLQYWDVQFSWIETVLRARDDYERSLLSQVKNAAAAITVERGLDTIMSRVKV